MNTRTAIATSLSLSLSAVFAHTSAAQAQPENSESSVAFFEAQTARKLDATRRAAAKIIDDAIDVAEPTVGSLRLAAIEAVAKLGSSSRTGQRVSNLVTETDIDDLERALEAIMKDLVFEPLREAPVPQDWPPLSPVDEVVLKSYPRYRMARANGGEYGAFMTLFNHIKKNEIPMTAPVEMSQGARGSEGMAFLYESTRQGEAGMDGKVEVVDIEPLTAISIGMRGYRRGAAVREAKAALQAWVKDRADEFETSGDFRIMGYNSPMVPAARQFFEVELPVTRRVQSAKVSAK